MDRHACQLLLTCVLLLGFICGCPGVFLLPISSDVPCFTLEWEDFFSYSCRSEDAGDSRLLFTAQTFDQAIEDMNNGMGDGFPHGAVYAYDFETETIELVDDEVWDTAGANSRGCIGRISEAFTLGTGSRLLFEGQPLPLVGGYFWNYVGAIDAPVVAVVSFNGFRNLPTLFGPTGTTGQHYHQLFSEETGQAVGPALRLGLGNGQDLIGVESRWTNDGRHVVHRSHQSFCIAPGITD